MNTPAPSCQMPVADLPRRLSPAKLVPALAAGLARRPASGGPAACMHAGALRASPPDSGLSTALSVIVGRFLRFDAAEPDWPDRDRLVIDAALPDLAITLETLLGLPEQLAAACPALGLAAGLAWAERRLAQRFGRSLVDHRTWVALAPASLCAGATLEAARLASALGLSRLVAVTAIGAAQAFLLAGMAAAGWGVRRVPNGDAIAMAAAISAALRAQRPSLIACVEQAGAPTAGVPSAHTHVEDRQAAVAEEDSAACWRASAHRGSGVRRAWLKRRARHASRTDLDAALQGRLPLGWHQALSHVLPGDALQPLAKILHEAARQAAAFSPDLTLLPEALLPGAAAMPGQAAAAKNGVSKVEPAPAASGDPRPAAMNRQPISASPDSEAALLAASLPEGLGGLAAGIAAHTGILPILFTPVEHAVRLEPAFQHAASGGRRLVVVLSGAERAASGRLEMLRALPCLQLFRPADYSEALECAEVALRHNGPSAILLPSGSTELLSDRPSRTRCTRGAYVLVEAIGARAATLIASGPEISLALLVQEALADRGLETAVVSLPCWPIFARQDQSWREAVLHRAPRIAIERGSGHGWPQWLGQDGLYLGAGSLADIGWASERKTEAAERIAALVQRHVQACRAVWTAADASTKTPAVERHR